MSTAGPRHRAGRFSVALISALPAELKVTGEVVAALTLLHATLAETVTTGPVTTPRLTSPTRRTWRVPSAATLASPEVICQGAPPGFDPKNPRGSVVRLPWMGARSRSSLVAATAAVVPSTPAVSIAPRTKVAGREGRYME